MHCAITGQLLHRLLLRIGCLTPILRRCRRSRRILFMRDRHRNTPNLMRLPTFPPHTPSPHPPRHQQPHQHRNRHTHANPNLRTRRESLRLTRPVDRIIIRPRRRARRQRRSPRQYRRIAALPHNRHAVAGYDYAWELLLSDSWPADPCLLRAVPGLGHEGYGLAFCNGGTAGVAVGFVGEATRWMSVKECCGIGLDWIMLRGKGEAYAGQHTAAVVSGLSINPRLDPKYGTKSLNVVAAVHPLGHIAGLSAPAPRHQQSPLSPQVQ